MSEIGQLYQALPTIEQSLSRFQVPYYTTVLRTLPGTKYVDNATFTDTLSQKVKDLFLKVGFPCYWIPIKQGKTHYGFILKSAKPKWTPSFSNWISVGNLDALYSSLPYVFILEGLKDIYLFNYYRFPVMAMLTSQMQDETYDELKALGKTAIIIPDNDDAGKKQSKVFLKMLRENGIPGMVCLPSLFHDFGNWLDTPALRPVIEATFRKIVLLSKALLQEGISSINNWQEVVL